MGTWGMGGEFKKDKNNIKESIEALREGLRLGYRLIDLAELYGEGLTEKIAGEAIKGFPREKLYIVTKVAREHLEEKDLQKAIRGSLKRLQTEYIDLYLVHKENPDVPLEETMRAMEKIADEGLARSIGVSNFSVPSLVKAQSYLDHTRIFADEIEYNLSTHIRERETVSYCNKNNIAIIASRPFSKGKILTDNIPLLDKLSKKYGKTRAATILSWIISKGMTPIPKAIDKVHLKENLTALDFIMEKKDIADIDKMF